jgi:hypothetical protein
MLRVILRRIVPYRWKPIGYFPQKTQRETGGMVCSGPFAGLKYPDDSYGSALVPKLLGIYEREIYPAIEQVCSGNFRTVVDIGAAEGYYAVGLAHRLPQARVVAYEMSPEAQQLLRQTCRLNNQADRLDIRGKCECDDLSAVLGDGAGAFVLCDCEGYEEVLLDPSCVPGLRQAHLLVESHDFIVPNIAEKLIARFAPTHRIERIWQTERTPEDYPFSSAYIRLLPARYRAWAAGEGRPARMSWLWMVPQTANGPV